MTLSSPDTRPIGTPIAIANERELELLRRIVAHDRDAFRELYLLYHRRLARFLMRMSLSPESVEEIINDTLWTVWQKAADFRGASRVSTWIVGIAYRRALKAMRQTRASRAPSRDDLDELPAANESRARHASGWNVRWPSCQSNNEW
jgi:RNA polymerase sigma-70 factor, ECF subfamily